ncbi:hypothetical protein lerEdw1_002642 [Lerista edwardsae]|nr:hypothetical protein lerEdw1_002642 [Lerista edwardsae]
MAQAAPSVPVVASFSPSSCALDRGAEEPGEVGRRRGPDLAHAAPSSVAMDLGPVTICGEVTVLHGGFLLAATLCHPKSLSELAKSDWPKVGKSILDALQEICTSYTVYPPQPTMWKKKAIVVLWSKILLSGAPSTSTNQRWKDDILFSVSNMIPEINHTVLFELLKAVNMPQLFAQLLLVLPEHICQKELETFVEYIATETSPEDVSFFLDVWWEILKHKEGQEDRLTLLFHSITHQHLSESDEMCQPPKRFKSNTQTSPVSPMAASLFSILMKGLKWIKDSIGPAKMKCCALANLVDSLSILITAECQQDSLPAHVYLAKISSVVMLWERDCENRFNQKELDEKVQEAGRSMSLLSVNQLLDESLLVDLGFLSSLLEDWSMELQGLLSDPQQICYESYRLLDSLTALQKNLVNRTQLESQDADMAQAMLELEELIADFLETNPKLRGRNSDSTLTASVAMVIIEKRMDRHMEICPIFASEKSWAFSQDWVACLVKNKELFQKPELILQLLETASAFSSPAEAPKIQKQQPIVSKTILECYMELSLPDKNKVISGVLATWGRQGLSSVLKTFSEEFQEELNVTFNQIIQSASGEGFQKAVAAVSRVVVLNPEATIKKMCSLAVANLGTHQFLAEILCSFPALSFQECQDTDVSISLVLRCLKETVWERISSAKEKEQLLEFIAYLMQPSGASPLLSPGEVTQNFVLPFLKSNDPRVELSLQILEKVLKVSVPSDPNWVYTCHPFPLILCLCKLLEGFTQYWHKPKDLHSCSLQSKDLVTTTLSELCNVMLAQKDSVSPGLWTQSVSWLHKKAATLDWTIGLRLKDIYGDYFKNEVPATLFEVCQLSEDEWTSRPLPSYGEGTGLLAWMECCCISTAMREQMLVLLVVNVDNPEEVNLFSKGFLLALIQVFPWCSQSEWQRLTHVVKSLLEREVLYIPYSLEYIQYLPLLNYRPFAYHLQFSVLLLRAFQFLCSSSGATWLSEDTWKHVARLYCLSLSDLLSSVKNIAHCQWHPAEEKNMTRELSFVYIQLYCHTLHVSAMLPDNGTGETLLLLALEILSQYEMLYDADESLGSTLRKANEKHFLESITENVSNKKLRTMLLQKLSKL